MKYVKKLPKTNEDLAKELEKEGFQKIKEPKNVLSATICALPICYILLCIVGLITYMLKPSLLAFMFSLQIEIVINFNLKTLICIIGVFIYMFIHEMIHAIMIPNFKKSRKTVWGLNGLFGFVATTEPLTKSRFIVISVMPFLIFTVLALFIFNFTNTLNGYTFALCIINAMGSCVDFLNVILVAFQIKNKSVIITNGFSTYYRVLANKFIIEYLTEYEFVLQLENIK